MADGSITSVSSLKGKVSAEEWQARVDLAALYRLVALYGWDDGADSNTVEVFISRLRRKLGSDCIQTLRGLGYRLALCTPAAER